MLPQIKLILSSLFHLIKFHHYLKWNFKSNMPIETRRMSLPNNLILYHFLNAEFDILNILSLALGWCSYGSIVIDNFPVNTAGFEQYRLLTGMSSCHDTNNGIAVWKSKEITVWFLSRWKGTNQSLAGFLNQMELWNKRPWRWMVWHPFWGRLSPTQPSMKVNGFVISSF